MARRSRRRNDKQTAEPAGDERRRLRRHAAVWLATLSTVVGVATGMFTLRDQVFPREAGTAEALSVPAYQQQVGRVCDDVNENDRRRAHEDRSISKALERTKTTIGQRNALLDGVRRTTARSGHVLASFTALETPTKLVTVRRVTEAAWARNLARLRDYAVALDHAGTRRKLVAAIEHLSTLRPALARDGDKIRSGLGRLGAANCDLEPPIVTRTFTLPPLRDEGAVQGASSTNTPSETRSESDPSTTDTSDDTTPSESTSSTNTPSPSSSNPNTPPSTGGDARSPGANLGPVTGGGED